MNKLRTMIQILALCAVTFIISGCGDDDYCCEQPPPPPPARIYSIFENDGDIARDPTGIYTVSQGVAQSVFAGRNPSTNVEFRAFLYFPLREAGGVPDNAAIDYAILDIMIDSILPQSFVGTIPFRIDLVEFQPPTLEKDYFDPTKLPARATTTVNVSISQANFPQNVKLDVTPLMMEAQRLHLANFQVRIMEDPGEATSGLIEINDTTGENWEALAPLLYVTYF